jgi:GET complex subunit GET2
MASPTPSTTPPSAEEQARIRKERRKAKITADPTARLQKIGLVRGMYNLSVGPMHRGKSNVAMCVGPLPQTTAKNPNALHVSDTEVVDLAQHFPQPASRDKLNVVHSQGQISDDQLRAMMLDLSSKGDARPPPRTSTEATVLAVQQLQRLMGLNPDQSTQEVSPSATGDSYAYLWRILHAVFALALALYLTLTTNFTGTRWERETSSLNTEDGITRFFYIFASVEVLLLTSRFFLEKGGVRQDGLQGLIMGFLPKPWSGYLALMVKYSKIWATVTEDAMVCVFVLGICSWLRAS